MSPEKIPMNTTAEDTVVTENGVAADSNQSNLLKFDDNAGNAGKDINTKISVIDTDLAHLRAELSAINNSVEEGLDRLGDTDTNLTAKVSETYKRLGEIDNAYKSLLEISSRIDSDIKKLNGDVSSVAEQSATGIKHLEQSTIAQSNEFSHRNEQVVSRVNHLVETSKMTGDLLNQKILTASEMIKQIENHVVSEIKNLSVITDDKTKAIEISVDSSRAKILKLQAVDEAIIKRATVLEISSAELTVKTQDMMSSIEQLEVNTGHLSSELLVLKERTGELENTAEVHTGLIDNLQKITSDITDNLATLARHESNHFNIFTISFLLLLVVSAVIYFSQQNQFEAVETKYAEHTGVMSEKITNLQQEQVETAGVAIDSISVLESKVGELNQNLQQELKNEQQAFKDKQLALKDAITKEIAQIDFRMKNMQDQVQSIEARFNNSSPLTNIGNDNTIHGAQWIAALPADFYTLQLAYVDDKSTMFELAERYNQYLKEALSFFEVEDNNVKKYVLLMGSFSTQQQANAQIEKLPSYIDMQKPVVRKLATVQKYINQ